jgi:hypothetical protein
MHIRKPWYLAFGLTLGVFPFSPGRPAEYAFTTYPLGSLSFGAGVTPPPGVYVTEGISFYTGTIGGTFDFGGRTFNAGVRADAVSGDLDILYVPDVKVFDGHLGLSVSIPAAYVMYTAKIAGPLNSEAFHTEGGGLGDTIVEAQLGWDASWEGWEFSHSFHILAVTPAGRYAPGFYPLVGFNRPSFDAGWAFTWFDKSSKLQVNGAVGFMAGLENDATHYQTGDEFHVEWAIGYKFDNSLEIGVVGYDYRQITGDSGPGAILGSFEGTVDAIGPCLSYSSKLGDTPVTISVRDYEQYNSKHFFQGNLALVSFTAAFLPAQSLKDTDSPPLK